MNGVAFRNCETLTSATVRQIKFFEQDYVGNLSYNSSYNVIMARLFNLTYPDFLRYCRDNYGAVLVGKEGFTYMVFYDEKKCDALVKELNKRWNTMVAKRKAANL